MNFYVDFIVIEMVNFGIFKFGVEVIGNFLGKFWYGIICKEFYIWYKWFFSVLIKEVWLG